MSYVLARFRRPIHLLEYPHWASLRVPEDCDRQSGILSQGPAPVSGVFPAGDKLHLLEIRLQAIQLSPCRADPLTHHPIRLGMTASSLACYRSHLVFRLRVSHRIQRYTSYLSPLRGGYNTAPHGAADLLFHQVRGPGPEDPMLAHLVGFDLIEDQLVCAPRALRERLVCR